MNAPQPPARRSPGTPGTPGRAERPRRVVLALAVMALAIGAVPAIGATPTAAAPTPSPVLTPGPVPPATSTPLPSPSPGPPVTTPTPDPADTSTPDAPGFFDIPGRVTAAIDSWLADLVSSALNPVLRYLGRTVLASPDPSALPRVRQLWTASQVAANTIAVLFLLAAGILVMTHETVQSRYALKDLVPRAVTGVIAANLSLQLIGPATSFANALTRALVGEGLDPESTGERLTQLLTGSIHDGGSFLLLLGLVTAVLAVVVVLTAIVRITVLILLSVGAPLFLICHASPATESIAILWWRAVAGCLLVQVAQAATLLAAMRIFLTPEGFGLFGAPTGSSGLITLLVSACLLWILARIPTWVFRMVFRARRSAVVGIVRAVVITRGLRAIGVLRR